VRAHAFLALFAALVVALGGCGEATDTVTYREPTAELLADGALRIREDSAPYVEVDAIGDEPVAARVRAPGRVAFREGAVSEVGAPVEGRITEVHVRVGQHVERGEALVTIASPSAASVRGQLAGARVAVASASAELARQEEMRAAGVGVAVELARASAQLAEARALYAALAASAASIGRGSAASVVVRAPIAGTVLERRATVGATTAGGAESLVTLGEPGAIWVVAQVYERELSLVTVGSTAQVSLPASARPVRARVESLGGAVDPATRRAPVYLSLEEEAVGARAGMFARADITVGASEIGVPTSAVLIRDGGRTAVFVEREPGIYASREIEIGAPVDGRAPVLAGLARGERVVVRGALLLDGQAELLR
jgi:cobalt-zinc-cadmium efflux system membrane fusion protein